MKDALGDRMKDFYENRYRFYLTRRMPVIIRVDGNAFHTFTRDLDRPFDADFMRIMQETCKSLCAGIQQRISVDIGGTAIGATDIHRFELRPSLDSF